MSKIVYLIEQPLDERNYERFGIQTWIDRGWDIEVWDLTPLSYPQFWRNYTESGQKLKEFGGYFPLMSLIELKRKHAMLGKVRYFIDLTGDNFYTIGVKIRLIRMGAVRAVCATGSIPKPIGGDQGTMKGKIRKALAKDTVKLFKSVLGIFFRKLLTPLIRPGLYVASGAEALQSVDSASEVIHAHNFDYDIYLRIKNSNDFSVEENVVFIDQNYCFHSDFICEDMSFPATPKNYFPAVCNALRNISDALGKVSCIAAHPRATYQDHDYFEGTPIKYGATAELIRNCSVVLCHDSTAIQYAVLFEKPIIIATTDELNASVWGASIAGFASVLGKTVINLDRDLDKVDWDKELHVDMEKYVSYRNKYIKTDGSPEKPIWDIVIDYMDKQVEGRSTVSSVY